MGHAARQMAQDDGMTGSSAERQAALLARLGALRDPQQRMSWVVERARHRGGMPADRRTPDRLVPGCAARVWFQGWLEGETCRFACDSDASILKAVAGLMCEIYDGRPPAEVAAVEPEFLEGTGLLRQFTENRRRTILRIRELIREFAADALLRRP